MKTQAFQALLCPIDNRPLLQHEKTWRCENGHSFDIAKQGYTHLLPVQNKRSLDPGDHKEMVAARQRFLNADYYLPIAKALNQTLLAAHTEKHVLNVLDAGCGEGYYLRELVKAESDLTLAVLGVDISKWAVLLAAKQTAAKQASEKPMTWIVASNANLPVETNSIDCVLCMFGFPVYKEFARVMKDDALLLQVDAGPEHLKELRAIIYPNQKEEKVKKKFSKEFCVFSESNIRYAFSLKNSEAISDLLAMTPHLYRAKAEAREKVLALSELHLSVDVCLTHYKKI